MMVDPRGVKKHHMIFYLLNQKSRTGSELLNSALCQTVALMFSNGCTLIMYCEP